jgi:transcriptional regulator with XRE-family HTH domain
MMRRFRTLKIPDCGHPLVRRLYAEMNNQRVGVNDLAERSGLERNTIQNWKRTTSPTLANIDAAFNVLGFEVYIRHRAEEA